MKHNILTATLGLLLGATLAFAPAAHGQSDESAPAPKTAASKKKAKKKKPAPKAAKAIKKKSYLERVATTPAGAKGKSAAGADHGSRLSRDIVFDGSTVNGQYHSAGEAVAKVEQEKKLNELAGVRHDFRDRLLAEKERLQRGEPVSAE